MTMITDATSKLKVPIADLRKACAGFEQTFEHSNDLPRGTLYLGQQRAIDAIRFGNGIERFARNWRS